MCRYMDHGFKTHYVCVPCRRSFKAHGSTFSMGGQPETSPCCECGEPAVNAGRDFKPPRRESDNQWRKVALLLGAGVRFDSCGCRGPGYRPRTLAETKALLRAS